MLMPASLEIEVQGRHNEVDFKDLHVSA